MPVREYWGKPSNRCTATTDDAQTDLISFIIFSQYTPDLIEYFFSGCQMMMIGNPYDTANSSTRVSKRTWQQERRLSGRRATNLGRIIIFPVRLQMGLDAFFFKLPTDDGRHNSYIFVRAASGNAVDLRWRLLRFGETPQDSHNGASVPPHRSSRDVRDCEANGKNGKKWQND